MKILQLVQRPQRRGAEIFAFQLTRCLKSLGHEAITVYLYPSGGEHSLQLQPQDASLAGNEHHFLEKTMGYHPGLLRSLKRKIEEFMPDVVQANGARTLKYGALARSGKSWKLVYRNIGDPSVWLRSRRHLYFYRRAVFPRVDGLVSISEQSVRSLREFYGPNVPMDVIPNAIEASWLVPEKSRMEIRGESGCPDSQPVVLYVGSLTSEKGVDRLLRIFSVAKSTKPDAALWIVGEGPCLESLQRQAAHLCLADSVQFWGGQSCVANFLNAADVFALCSNTEGIPAAILEAGYFGLPSVATNVGGIPDCALDGKTAFLAEPSDEQTLANALSRLVCDPELRANIGLQARQWIRTNFLMEQVGPRYVNFYERCLNEGK